MKFQILIQQDEDGAYIVSYPAISGCYSQGDTREEALFNIKEAIELNLEHIFVKKRRQECYVFF